MFRSIFGKSLRDQARSFFGWSVGVVSLVVVMAALWPSVRRIPDLDRFLQNYPEAMRKLFNIQTIGTGTGFMNAELFTFMLPVLFIVYGIGRGARAIAGEEQAGTLDVLLSTPLSRARILAEKAAALTASIVSLGGVLFIVILAAARSANMGIGTGELAAGVVGVTLLGLEFGLLSFCVGAATGRRGVALAVSGAAAAAAYVLYVVGALVDSLAPWRIASPFQQALRAGPIGATDPALAWLALGALVAVLASVPLFERRDIKV